MKCLRANLRKLLVRNRMIAGLLLTIMLLTSACTSQPADVQTYDSTQPIEASNTDVAQIGFESTKTLKQTPVDTEAKIHFIDVGQGDSILFESNDHYMLVDAGENGLGQVVVDYLNSLGVTKLDYIIGTHPHSDHIGGLDTVINSFEIGKVILPSIEHTTKTFEDVITAISSNGLKIINPVVGDSYELGNASFTIVGPNQDYGDELNNWSIGIKFRNGTNSVMACGDAELEAEYDICENGIDLKADILKVGHHGSTTSTSEAIVKAVQPKYAVIQCGIGNSYGHPHIETLKRLTESGIQVFRNDEQGTIIATSDGEQITWSSNPSATMAAGVETVTQAPTVEAPTSEALTDETTPEVKETQPPTDTAEPKSEEVHITNTGSKYHSGGCQYLKKSDIVVTLDNAKSMGLTPCSKCNPPS